MSRRQRSPASRPGFVLWPRETGGAHSDALQSKRSQLAADASRQIAQPASAFHRRALTLKVGRGGREVHRRRNSTAGTTEPRPLSDPMPDMLNAQVLLVSRISHVGGRERWRQQSRFGGGAAASSALDRGLGRTTNVGMGLDRHRRQLSCALRLVCVDDEVALHHGDESQGRPGGEPPTFPRPSSHSTNP